MADKIQRTFAQLVRYALVGVASNLTGYLIYYLVTYLGGTPKITMTLLYSVGATVGYFGNRNYTFSHQESYLASGVRYLIAHFFGYCINLAILVIFVDKLGYPHQWVQAIAIFIVAGFLYITFKFFVFTSPQSSSLDRP